MALLTLVLLLNSTSSTAYVRKTTEETKVCPLGKLAVLTSVEAGTIWGRARSIDTLGSLAKPWMAIYRQTHEGYSPRLYYGKIIVAAQQKSVTSTRFK